MATFVLFLTIGLKHSLQVVGFEGFFWFEIAAGNPGKPRHYETLIYCRSIILFL